MLVCIGLKINNNYSDGTLSPVECRFVEKPFEWQAIDCNYELDDIFPIQSENNKLNIEQQFQRTVESVRSNLAASEIFLQQESIDDTLTLEAYMRRKLKQRKEQTVPPATEKLRASIFLPVKCQISSNQPIKVRQFNGTIRFAGAISSRIWCNAQNTLGDIKRFIRVDVVRSLATRIQIYCDALTEPVVSYDAVFVSEPPRRVYFNLPTDEHVRPVQFSEYIFRGEAPTVAVAQAKQVLDLDISPTSIEADVETLIDDECINNSDSFGDTCSEQAADATSSGSLSSVTSSDPSRSMYMLGIAVALFVLLVAIFLHFILK